MEHNCIVICGPTASGKTRIAVEIARKVGGEILSADSRQVYRGMDIGTGKDLCEYGEPADDDFVPYHLIDIADPRCIYTLYDYQRDFYRTFEDVRGRGRVPVICGGTGLYIEAVIRGYDIAPVPENAEFRKTMMNEDRETLIKILRDESPEIFAKTDVSTKKRVVRALEIARFGGGNRASANNFPQINPQILYVTRERSELRERIKKRLYERLENGMIEEVEGLLRAGIAPERFALFGMEYKHAARYISGEVTRGGMTAQLLQDIYHLAKRQDTWFRGMERRCADRFSHGRIPATYIIFNTMKKIIIATGNAGKVKEFGEMFANAGLDVEVSSLADYFDPLPEIVEDGATFYDNAKIKADWLFERRIPASIAHTEWTLADDSGLEVDALGGAPGVISARYSGEGATAARNNEKLLNELRGVPEEKRTARFRCVLVLKTGAGKYHTAQGVCEGRIINEPMGEKGFGYDPIFIPNGYDMTFAQLGAEEKNRISHRGMALRKLCEVLRGIAG